MSFRLLPRRCASECVDPGRAARPATSVPTAATVAALALGALAAHAPSAGGQSIIRPAQRWESVSTAHFTIDYPASTRDWALALAARLERIRLAVGAVVQHLPSDRVTVLIDDPSTTANGFALPFIGAPTIVLWPDPPSPADDIANYAEWPELLATHEFAHIAHLTEPSRNPRDRLLWRLLPEDIGPVARRAPPWVREGYATLVEGTLTGRGRPYGAYRASLLRALALEGALPSYAALNGSGRFEGGALPYLAGSAYLEWLTARAGDSSLPHLWRRLSARTDRTFGEAFVGVYGQSPEALYGRFTAELTGKALSAATWLSATGIDSGETVRRLGWYSGSPALSHDGALLAVAVREPDHVSRIVIWPRVPTAEDSAAPAAARRALLARDPQDVPAVQTGPIRAAALAELTSSHGRSFDEPRFIPGRPLRLLLSRLDPVADGALRPDLYIWTPGNGRVRRLTHGADVRGADPAPDGRSAVAMRCHDGACDLVRVSLLDGRVTLLRAGSVARSYDRPRFAPDGRSVVVAVHDSAYWTVQRVVLAPRAGRPVDDERLTADTANAYDPVLVAGGRRVVFVSDAGGIPHLVLGDLRTGEELMLAATPGTVLGPETSTADASVYFLIEHAAGYDLARVPLADARAIAMPVLPDTLSPVAIPSRPRLIPLAGDTARRVVDAAAPGAVVHPYRAGPRGYRVLPGGALATDGRFATALVGSTDPVGQLAWTLQGALGDAGTWRGGALAAAWRGWPVALEAAISAVHDAPSRQVAGRFAPDAVDADLQDATIAGLLVRDAATHAESYRLGASIGHLAAGLADGPPEGDARREDRRLDNARLLIFADARTAIDVSPGEFDLGAGAVAQGAAGENGGATWQRALVSADLHAGPRAWVSRGDVTIGGVSPGAPPFERFLAGGVVPPLSEPDVLAQRIAEPVLPLGIGYGRTLLHYRLATDIPASPFVAYFDGLAVGGALRGWHRVYGTEATIGVPALGFARLPALRALVGAGYSIDPPFKYKLRGYLAVRYAP